MAAFVSLSINSHCSLRCFVSPEDRSKSLLLLIETRRRMSFTNLQRSEIPCCHQNRVLKLFSPCFTGDVNVLRCFLP